MDKIDRLFDNIEENRQRILELKDKEKGKDIYILGTSAKLTNEFIDTVRDKVTIGVSGIVFAKKAWDFEPTYYGQSDPLIWYPKIIDEGYKCGYNNLYGGIIRLDKSIKVFSEFMLTLIIGRQRGREPTNARKRIGLLRDNIHLAWTNEDMMKFPYTRREYPTKESLCFDLMKGTYHCGSVVQDIAIPLAVWLGAKNIHLKGCTSEPNGHFYSQVKQSNSGKMDVVRDQYKLFGERLKELDIGFYNLDKRDIPGTKHYE